MVRILPPALLGRAKVTFKALRGPPGPVTSDPDPELWSLFSPGAAEGGRAVLVSGGAGAGGGDPGPLPLSLQLRVWMRHTFGTGPSLQVSQWHPTDLLPL